MSTTLLEKPAVPLRSPATDVIEGPDHWTLVADVPGADETSLEVTVEADVLKVRAQSPSACTPSQTPAAYQEYIPGSYERRFTLTDEVDRDGIEASLRDGVLRLRIPKAVRAQARRIPIKVQ